MKSETPTPSRQGQTSKRRKMDPDEHTAVWEQNPQPPKMVVAPERTDLTKKENQYVAEM